MPHAPGAVPRPILGLEGSKSMHVLCQEAIERLERIVPVGHPARAVALEMTSPFKLDHINDAISRYQQERAAATAPPPELCAAWQEIASLWTSYNTIVFDLQAAQRRWLSRAQTSWKHKLLRSFKANDFTSLEPLPPWQNEDFPTVVTARQQARKIHARLQWAEGLRAAAGNAAAFDGQPLDAQAVELCCALYSENIALKNRIIAIESAVSALQARRALKKRKALAVAKKARAA